MKANPRSRFWPLAVAVLVGSITDLRLLRGEAHAIIGRPLTPFSIAGVARRTTRRAVFFGAAAQPYPYAYPAAVPAPVPYGYPPPGYPPPAPAPYPYSYP